MEYYQPKCPDSPIGELVGKIQVTYCSSIMLFDVTKHYFDTNKRTHDVWLNKKHYLGSYDDYRDGFTDEKIESFSVDSDIIALIREEENDYDLTVTNTEKCVKLLLKSACVGLECIEQEFMCQLGFNPVDPVAINLIQKLCLYCEQEKNQGGYDYIDNYRVAISGNQEQETRYKEIKSNGCCGFYDNKIMIEGIEFLIGWNYGH